MFHETKRSLFSHLNHNKTISSWNDLMHQIKVKTSKVAWYDDNKMYHYENKGFKYVTF